MKLADNATVEKIIHELSYEELKTVYKELNCWRWPELLGKKPDGWEDMPNYSNRPNESVCTKKDFIRPYMLEIRKLRPSIHEDVYKCY